MIAADDSTNGMQSDLKVTVDLPVSRKSGIDIRDDSQITLTLLLARH